MDVVRGEEAQGSPQSEIEGGKEPSQPLMDGAKQISVDDDEEAWLELERRIRKGEEARCVQPCPAMQIRTRFLFAW